MARREREQAKDFASGVLTGGYTTVFDAGERLFTSIAKDPKKSGIAQGAATGAYFGGPVGAFIGAGVGGAFGFSQSRKAKREQFEQYKKNLKLSYEIGEDSVTGMKKSRSDIEKTYQANVASSRAQFAARGAETSGLTWDRIVGQHVTERDAALGKVGEQEVAFRESDAGKYIQRDYSWGFHQGEKGVGLGSQNPQFGYSLTTGEDFLTKDQRSNIRAFGDPIGEGDPDRELINFSKEYYNSIAPSYDQFETLRFGTDEEKAAIRTDMDQRIELANKRYDDFMALREIDEQNRRFEEGYL